MFQALPFSLAFIIDELKIDAQFVPFVAGSSHAWPPFSLADDDILLPEDVLKRMLKEILSATAAMIQGVKHYMIIFQRNEDQWFYLDQSDIFI